MTVSSQNHKLIVITGPTASGKTQLAIDVAKHYQTEIVSFDSRQFFKELSIGTAKPTLEQLNEVPHHFISNISVQDEYNAGTYELDAIKKLDELFQRKEVIVATGGSGMYLDAILYGFDELPKVEEALREKLNKIYEEEGIEVLQTMLAKLDPEHYNNVDLQNPHRLLRALEVCLATGIPFSQQRKRKTKQRNFTSHLFGIDLEREELYGAINNRVDEMIAAGLLDEVRSLSAFCHLNALQTVGYKELFQHMEGKLDMETAVNLIKQNTRRFAKRQMTWFRKYEEMNWVKKSEAKNKIIKEMVS